jgi:hypothetical protein
MSKILKLTTNYKTTGKGIAVFILLGTLSACLPYGIGKKDSGDSHLSVDRSEASLSAQDLYNISVEVRTFLTNRFKQAESKLDAQFASCSNPEQMANHAFALLAFGREQECLQAVNKCMSEVSGKGRGRIAYAGGTCAWRAGNYSLAYDMYRESTKKDLYGSDPDYLMRVFEFARFVEVISFKVQGSFKPERTAKEIFALGFSSGDRNSFNEMYSLVRAAITSNSNVFEPATPSQTLKNFMEARINSSIADFSDYLRVLYFGILSGDYRQRDALVALRGWIAKGDLLSLPYHLLHRIFIYSYSNLYIQPDQAYIQLDPNVGQAYLIDNVGLYTAKEIFDAYMPYSNAKYGLPESQNFYAYDQIAIPEICGSKLLDGAGQSALAEIASAFEAGNITPAEAINRAVALDKNGPKADLKTFLGNMYHLDGRLEDAEEQYLMAREACRYYNRGHGGLNRLRVQKVNESLPEYSQLKKTFIAKAGGSEPTAMPRYIVNYNQLDAEKRKLIQASLSLFGPYINFLVDNGYTMYLKHVYQKLSQVPASGIKAGERVPDYDQRLHDDISGVSHGKIIVSDLLDALEVPYGGSNTLLHEAAHQFHSAASSNVKQCIAELYTAARAANNRAGLFSVGYAETNEHEYFAMGVQHYNIPEGSPSYMGISRGWYLNNDPRLFLLIQKIEAAAGDMDKVRAITCPSASDPILLSQPSRDITASILKGSDGKGHFLGVAMDPEVDKAYICFGPEVDCRNGSTPVTEMSPSDFVGATSFFIYPRDLNLKQGDAKIITLLGKMRGSARFTHAVPVSVNIK